MYRDEFTIVQGGCVSSSTVAAMYGSVGRRRVGHQPAGAAAIKNSIWDRRHDNKLYFNPDLRRMNLNTGDRFGFRLDVIPFAAEATKWRDIGRGLSQEGIPRSTDVRPE